MSKLLQKNRSILFRKYPLCELCKKKPTVEIHHRDETKTNHKINNLMALCKHCHRKIHGKHYKKYGKTLKELIKEKTRKELIKKKIITPSYGLGFKANKKMCSDIKKIAERDGRTISIVLRIALEKYIKENK